MLRSFASHDVSQGKNVARHSHDRSSFSHGRSRQNLWAGKAEKGEVNFPRNILFFIEHGEKIIQIN